MVELVDTLDLGSSAERCVGSTPSIRTKIALTFMPDFVTITLLFLVLVFLVIIYIKLSQKNSNQDSALMIQMNEQLRNEIEKIRETFHKSSGEQRREIQERLDTISKTINVFQKSSSDDMQKRFDVTRKIIVDLTEKLKEIEGTNKQVLSFAQQIKTLEKILGNQKQRGILGEIQLENLLANVLPPELFTMQYKFANGDTVDAVIRVGDFLIPVDAKFSLDNYNRMIETNDESIISDLEKKFKEDIKNRIDETSKYIKPSEKTTEYAYMFIPADGLYQDLLNSRVGSLKINSKDLVSYAYTKKVMIVSPMSLFPMLQITVKALHNFKVEKSIQDIFRNIEKLSSHLNAYSVYHNKLGATLSTTVNHYNIASKEFKKIDKDILKISDGNSKISFEPDLIDKPKE